MHALPLPFGMALAVLPRRQMQQLARPKAARDWQAGPGPSLRDRIRTETRYAEFRQRLFS
jgi:hypothetical protein